MGATYAAIGRGIPAIAFSAGNSAQRGYQTVNRNTTSGGYPADPATVTAQLAVDLVTQIVANKKRDGPIFPNGYGVNVNIPFITSTTNASCIAPKYYHTRLTGGASTDYAAYNETSGLFTYQNLVPPEGTGVNACINGDCALPGESQIVTTGSCRSSVSVFTIDYDAPDTSATKKVMKSMEPLVNKWRGKLRAKRGERSLNTRYAENRKD